MSARSHHNRYQSPYVYIMIDGIDCQFSAQSSFYINKKQVRYIAKKCQAGKIKVYPTEKKHIFVIENDKSITQF